ncbi:MAG: ferrous iron transport protein B [Ignavibacteria bacterium]|nr:MAG: ferrous iron transport protein B [Ignavibacteria bacterium]KAF0161982.1 MAG: ferrous iron transport protein B [Ignavibacteria bacterium]
MTYSESNIETLHLSDLHNDGVGIITKVKGHGAFRKRITEMGFVKGKAVKVIKNAPLQDPIEYEILGFRVSLRRSEAELIEVVHSDELSTVTETSFEGSITYPSMEQSVVVKTHTINIALVGNPNSGKTTLFNYATGKHERVGNYGGVTVDTKEAHLTQDGYTINITDLPGTYSISEYSPEELFVRKHISEKMPDVVVNVIDASNLERNLFLTSQLMDMNINVVIALNMYDELENKGDKLDYANLGKIIGIPIVTTVASKGEGIKELIRKVIDVYENNDPISRNAQINYGTNLEESLERLTTLIKKNSHLSDLYYPRYAAIKLIENDKSFNALLSALPKTEEMVAAAKKEITKLEKEFKEKSDTIIADAKYGFISGVLKETYAQKQLNRRQKSHAIDIILTHKYLGFPVFIVFLWLMFQLTFSLGSYPMDWIDAGIGVLGSLVSSIFPNGSLHDLIIDGIIGGVGGVIIFLPNILILFFCISLMEDTGYMARAAFIMDKLMHKIGLHGKSFIPLIMGFGCNVPAVMSTRTLENRKDRILTMLIIPFMSCSARLPVYVLFISAFFPQNQGLVLLSIYLIGILLAILAALLFKRIFFAKQDVPFVMELPPYRIPTLRNTLIHMWSKSIQYLTKMGTVILTASIIIWALGYFPREVEYSINYDELSEKVSSNNSLTETQKEEQLTQIEIDKESERMENSYIGKLGHMIVPVIQPLGWDWKIGVSILTGLAAKEIVVGSMGVLYQSDMEADETSTNLRTKLQQQAFTSGPRIGEKVFTPLVAYSLMLFILIYFPCVAVIAAIKKEANWKWAVFTMVYTTILAWLAAFAVYQIGSIF